MNKSAPKTEAAPLEPEKLFETLTLAQTAGLGSLSWLGTKWVETMSDVGAEWMSFVAERVKEDVKTQHALLHAGNLGEIRQIQSQFLQKAMDDYQAETGKVVEFCSQAMREIQEHAMNDIAESASNGKTQPKT